MPGPAPTPIHLSPEEADALSALVRRRTAPQNLVLRARIILAASEGLGLTATAQRLAIARKTVHIWRQRWRDDHDRRAAETPTALPALIEAGLSDAPRSGAPLTFSAEQVARIVALALRPPEDFGRPVTHWTRRDLADEAVAQGIVESVSPRTVGRFLKRGRPQTAPSPVLAQPDDR
jgi:putative transposase